MPSMPASSASASPTWPTPWPPSCLSGQRTLVGIVKATLHRPALLVLDEPTASLDPDVAQRVRAGVERICDEDGTALLVTSHNMTDVERMCERVVFLSAGRVVADGSPADVASSLRAGQPRGGLPPPGRAGGGQRG